MLALCLHFRFGEAPRAYIVAKKGTSPTADEIHAFMAKNAAPYKQLVGGIEFMELIPKTASGKILRKDLVAAFKESS
jgi:acyl-coenzyme A synthetase/AMP-(fatty) acid ligase